MKVLIIEDEVPAQRYLKKVIQEIKPYWEFLFPLQSVEESLEFFEGNEAKPDLIFMDIQLTDGLSFEILEKTSVNIPIIFVTAYDEYALRAFQVNSIDYLLKPVEEKWVQKAIEKFEAKTTSIVSKEEVKNIQTHVAEQSKAYRKRIWGNTAVSMEALNVRDIACFHSQNKTTYAQTEQKASVTIDFTLDKLEYELDPSMFFRVNRQYIVNVNAVKSIEPFYNGKWVLRLKTMEEEEIVIPKEKAPKFKKWVVD
ncbi:LytR/AlgR family response regulator transcription factor [Flammeovirga aprica]|uniref:Response regulator transcription factor n=1 Tax=Flammeovirga aprica JL-4 TaxID=694437 RepID=A0A7X9RTM2_9BACT|nr:LytTR family DNA-binding domain-containing protein [Flammeovirga aprica]NME68611.1 response regulator transcription factor [Flammeovirga aprica JL-4]